MKGHKSNILVISLSMLVMFSILAVGLYRIVMPQLSLISRMQHFILSSHTVRGICLRAKLELEEKQKDSEIQYDSLHELTRQREGVLGSVNYTYSFMDEESKININSIPMEVLKRLPGMGEILAEKITESALKPFNAKEELLMVSDMNEEKYSKIKDFITTYSSASVNINTAPPEVLFALGLEESLVDIIISFRGGSDGEEGTEDDGVFQSRGGIVETLKSSAGLFVSQQTQLQNAVSKGWFGVKGYNFSLRIETEIFGKKALSYDIIMDTRKIFRWQES